MPSIEYVLFADFPAEIHVRRYDVAMSDNDDRFLMQADRVQGHLLNSSITIVSSGRLAAGCGKECSGDCPSTLDHECYSRLVLK